MKDAGNYYTILSASSGKSEGDSCNPASGEGNISILTNNNSVPLDIDLSVAQSGINNASIPGFFS